MNPVRKKSWITLVIALAFTLVSAVASFGGVPTEVVVNKSTILNLGKPAERISITNPAIADIVLISPRQVQINGLATGTTSLIVWEKGAAKPTFFDIAVVGDTSMIEAQIKDVAPNDTITAAYVKDSLILTGKASSEFVAAKAVQIAQAYSAKVINQIQVEVPQVLLEVKVAQVDKNALRQLGVSGLIKGNTAEGFYNIIGAPQGGSTVTTSGGATTVSSGTGTGIAGNVPALGTYNPLNAFQAGVSYFPAGIGAVIQALATKGMAKILAEPNLLVKSGQKGEFLAGSKIPYNIVTSTGGTATTSIVFQDVGVKLNFAPVVQDNGVITLKIDPAEVSSISGTLQVNGYPIIDTRSVKTEVELREGEGLVMAGLLQEDEIRTMSKIPLLGDIPILGALFRSTQKELKEKELVFFVTPKIIKPMTPGTKPAFPTDNRPTAEEKRELNWVPTIP
ncbi:MAG: pilus assembly protein N-terminal domain-containing protein [Geobacter sp.]|nr:pilus assembly protein N-terminal domain-containing protein [Geobacter sp.]